MEDDPDMKALLAKNAECFDLKAKVAKLELQIQEQQKIIEKYAGHLEECKETLGSCICGFDAAKNQKTEKRYNICPACGGRGTFTYMPEGVTPVCILCKGIGIEEQTDEK